MTELSEDPGVTVVELGNGMVALSGVPADRAERLRGVLEAMNADGSDPCPCEADHCEEGDGIHADCEVHGNPAGFRWLAEVSADRRADLADYLADKTFRVVDLPASVKAQMMRDDSDSYLAAVRGERAAEVEKERR